MQKNMIEEWPYNLAIFRRSHKAVSPDGNDHAEIEKAYEVSMSSPTCGALRTRSCFALEYCSPSFIWSDDSRYLAVPQFFTRFGLLRRQRIAIVDIKDRRGYLSRQIGFYYQPESFAEGVLSVTKEPFKKKETIQWKVPECFSQFTPFEAIWNEEEVSPESLK